LLFPKEKKPEKEKNTHAILPLAEIDNIALPLQTEELQSKFAIFPPKNH